MNPFEPSCNSDIRISKSKISSGRCVCLWRYLVIDQNISHSQRRSLYVTGARWYTKTSSTVGNIWPPCFGMGSAILTDILMIKYEKVNGLWRASHVVWVMNARFGISIIVPFLFREVATNQTKTFAKCPVSKRVAYGPYGCMVLFLLVGTCRKHEDQGCYLYLFGCLLVASIRFLPVTWLCKTGCVLLQLYVYVEIPLCCSITTVIQPFPAKQIYAQAGST